MSSIDPLLTRQVFFVVVLFLTVMGVWGLVKDDPRLASRYVLVLVLATVAHLAYRLYN